MSVNIKATGGLNIEWGQIDPKVTGGLIMNNINTTPQDETRGFYNGRLKMETLEQLHTAAVYRRAGEGAEPHADMTGPSQILSRHAPSPMSYPCLPSLPFSGGASDSMSFPRCVCERAQYKKDNNTQYSDTDTPSLSVS